MVYEAQACIKCGKEVIRGTKTQHGVICKNCPKKCHKCGKETVNGVNTRYGFICRDCEEDEKAGLHM